MKKTVSLILAVLTLLSLCACGSSNYYAASEAVTAPAAAPSYAEEMYSLDEYELGGFAASGMPAESAAEAPAESSVQTPALNPDKIIYSGDATIETTEFDAAVEGLNTLVSKHGGFIEQSSINGSNYYSISRGYSYNRSASYTIRIPSSSFNTAMTELSGLGNVPYSYIYTTNITSQYYDTAARLKSYQVQEETLLELLDRAESIDDVLAVQSELSNVRYRIESLQSTLNNWDRQVSYSTINVSIDEVKEYTPEAKESYGHRLARAFRTGFTDFWDFLKDLLVWFAESLPSLVVLAVIGFFGVKGIKKLNAKRRAKKEVKREAKTNKENSGQ